MCSYRLGVIQLNYERRLSINTLYVAKHLRLANGIFSVWFAKVKDVLQLTPDRAPPISWMDRAYYHPHTFRKTLSYQ